MSCSHNLQILRKRSSFCLRCISGRFATASNFSSHFISFFLRIRITSSWQWSFVSQRSGNKTHLYGSQHLSKTFTNFFFSSISLFTAQTWAGLSVISKPPGLTVIFLTGNQTLENVLPPLTQIAPLAVATFVQFLSPSNGILIFLSTDDSCYNNSHSILLRFLLLEWHIPY